MHDDSCETRHAAPDLPGLSGAGGQTTQSGSPVRLFLIAPDDLKADSLRRALNCEMSLTVVAMIAPDGEVVDAIGWAAPDVVLVAAAGSDVSANEAIGRCLGASPGAQIVLLTDDVSGQAVADAMAAGCAGFATWEASFDELVGTIHTVADGGTRVPGELAGELADMLRPGRRAFAGLTNREREILALLAGGATTNEIAAELCLSVHTVRNHIRNTLTKLDARSRLAAVAIATRRGLLSRTRGRMSPALAS